MAKESEVKSKKKAVKKTAKKAAKKAAKKKSFKKRPLNLKGLEKKTLIVVESPAKAKTINKYLGSKVVIEASMGHIIDLPKSRMAVDIEHGYTPEYITVRGRADILNRLKKIAAKTKNVLLAPDPDREGEAISWHLKNALEKFNPDIKRIVFNEITKEAIVEAVKHPMEIDMARVNAQQGRRVLDRLVGYSLSPILWKKVKKGLSAGRVQSVALKLICDREEEIDKFVPSEYWTFAVSLSTAKKKKFLANLLKISGEKVQIDNEAEVKKIEEDLKNSEFKLASLNTKIRKRKPTAPYTTSKLQQDGSIKLGFSSIKTMSVAQQLYEGIELSKGEMTGLITYMRTDSTRISESALSRVRNYIKEKLGEEYLPEKPLVYKAKKGSQDAHEAIRPTDSFRTPESLKDVLSKEQYKLYDMIWRKFVSSQMTEEQTEVNTADIENGKYLFRASGSVQRFDGFAKIFQTQDKKAKKSPVLPAMKEGEILNFLESLPEQHFTQPPPRFNDASLVKTLEESGVGRPSTYAPTMATLLKRFYISRIQKQQKPTELGILVNKIISENFPELVNVKFTADMEENLDKVEEDNLDWKKFIAEFYEPFSKKIEHTMEHLEEMRTVLDVETDIVCEKCGRKMVKRIGRFGYFLACPGFPECRNAKAIPLGKCPKCEDGFVVKRATKKGRAFYGCNNYPDCEFSTWDVPIEGSKCPKCGKLLLEKSTKEKGKFTVCSDENCDYTSAPD